MTRRPLVTCQIMSWPMHFRKTLTLAIPLALGQLMSIGINTADIIAMGQIGTYELAAGSLAARSFQGGLVISATTAVGRSRRSFHA